MNMGLHTGTNYALEAEANELLRKGREGVTKLSDKKDYLTEEQLALRWDREIPNGHGFPEAAIVSGLYRRAYNPLAGKRPSGSGRSVDDG
jgi:hypothetical protein